MIEPVLNDADYAELFDSWGQELEFIKIKINKNDNIEVSDILQGIFIVQDYNERDFKVQGRHIKDDLKVFFSRANLETDDIVFFKDYAFKIIEIYLQNPDLTPYAYFVGAKTDQRNFHELIPKH